MIGAFDTSPGGVWIDYIRQALGDSQSIVAIPVTGSLVSPTLFSCRDVICTSRASIYWTACDTDWVLPAGYQLLLQEIAEYCTMDAEGFSAVDNRAGVTLGVDLYVPWDAPEAVIYVSSAGVVPLRNMPDVIGLVGRHENATESRVLQGRDPRSIRVLVPDGRGLDQNFHDVTIVDMGDLPESHVSMPELSELIHKWPLAVINHMMWEVPTEASGALYVLWCSHQELYVSACGTPPLGVDPVVAMPSVVVHRLEGRASGFYGPYP